jgi:predicted nucleic acid-binding protein
VTGFDAFTALFDACVLFPGTLRDLLLSLSLTNLFRVRWTDRIHDEWMTAVQRDRPDLAERLARTRQLMDDAIPDATVTGYETLSTALTLPDPDDRHVLAAAIVGGADVIVTANLKDFPAEALEPFGIEAQHPDEFISHVLTLSPQPALAAVRQMRLRLRQPAYTADEFLALLLLQGLVRTVAVLRDNIRLM